MFSKYITLLAFAASAIAGVIKPGVYRIFSVHSHSSARSYEALTPVFVSSTKENPGPFELWDVIEPEDGSYILRNLGLRTFASGSAGELVETRPVVTSYNIEPAGDSQFVIMLPNEDSVWTVESVGPFRSNIKLLPANGRTTQRWIFVPESLVQDEYEHDERWELLQRIGRFLGRI